MYGKPAQAGQITGVATLSEALQGSLSQPADGEHIVLIVDQFPAVLGGGERVVLRTARMLREAEYRVSIVTFQVLCAPEVLAAAKSPVYLLPLETVFSVGAFRAALQLGKFLRRSRASVVMTYFESSNLFGGIVVKALTSARLIWNRRDMGILREPKHRIAYRWLPFLPDSVIAVSEQVRRNAIEVDRIPAERVSVVYNGVAGAVGSASRTSAKDPVIVTVGNLRHVKGHDILVEAAALVLKSFPEAQILLAGEALEPDYAAALERRIADLGMDARVKLVGGVAAPSALFEKASIFVLPSRSEGFSNAIVEAMAAGLPVVATNVGGNAEAVQDGVTGILVPTDQPESLARALLELLRDPERSRRMGEAGRLRAAERFSEAAMLRDLTLAFGRAKAR